MPTGRLKWFNPDKGYGFISRDGDKDVFLHARTLSAAQINAASLNPGDGLIFEIEQRDKGLSAINVRLDPR